MMSKFSKAASDVSSDVSISYDVGDRYDVGDAVKTSHFWEEMMPYDQVWSVLDRIRDLPQNWDGYGAIAADRALVHGARELLGQFAKASVPPPSLAPTPGGGVQAYWECGPRYFEIDVVGPNLAEYFYRDLSQRRETSGEIMTGESLGSIIHLAREVFESHSVLN